MVRRQSMDETPQTNVEVSALVPVHNEEGNIATFVDKTLKAYNTCAVTGEIVFIDDGSTDGTLAALERCRREHDRIKIVKHRKKSGLTECLKTGLKNISGKIVILLPADLESDPEEDIPKLLREMEKGYDVVAGWRQDRGDGKVLSSKIYNTVSRWLFRVPAHDMNWIKAAKTGVFENLHFRSDWHRYMLPVMAAAGYKIGEVQTNWYPRRAGKSKFGFSRAAISFFDLLAVKFLLVFTKKPMFFFGSVGVIFIGIGLAMGLYLLYLYLALGANKLPVLLVALVLALFGVILLMLGCLSELIVSGQQRIEEIEERLGESRPDKESGR
ncbi:MAG: glycosyltransferase [Candidatus Eisenbacteria bacterium]